MRDVLSARSFCGLTAPVLGLVLAGGCLHENWAGYDALYQDSSSSSSTLGAGSGETTVSSITITGSASASDSGPGTTDGSTTTGSETTDATTEDVADDPPAILDVAVDPPEIVLNGPVTVRVTAEGCDGVRMRLASGLDVDLAEVEPGSFEGDVAVLTGLDNGPQSAWLTPWRGDVEGKKRKASYQVSLPEPGSEIRWGVDVDVVGKGWVVAMETLQTGDVIELGTRLDADEKNRCYMRRWSVGGEWDPSDVVAVLPSEECEAVDLAVGEGGTIHPLVTRKVNADTKIWWLGDIASWGSAPLTLAMGSIGEEAKALAERDGTLALCGAVPSGYGDLDGIVRRFEPGEPDVSRTFDYVNPEKIEQKHSFVDNPEDCLFTDEDRVLIVGDVTGPHTDDETLTSRRFALSLDPGSVEELDFIVPESGVSPQSFATALVRGVDEQVFATGYVCGDPCLVVEGKLWLMDEKGNGGWSTSLGLYAEPLLAPQSLGGSEVGYVVVGSGGQIGDDDSFSLRAFTPNSNQPVWSYSRMDPFQTHITFAVAMGPYGEVYAGGLGSSAYPAIARVGS